MWILAQNQVMPMPIFPAFQKDEAFLTEIRNTATAADCFACWRLGHGGFLIKWAGKHLLLVASSSLEELPLDPNQLDFLDVVVANSPTPDILKPILMANPKTKLLIPEANRVFFAEQIGCDPAFPIGIDAGQSRDIQGFKFWAMPAAHEADGLCRLGYVVQFGGFCIYYSGDTLLYDGMAELLRPYGVDVAFLPIYGRHSKRGVDDNLDYAEAVGLGKAIGVQYVIPYYCDMDEIDSADVRIFEGEAKKIETGHKMLKNGEGVRFVV